MKRAFNDFAQLTGSAIPIYMIKSCTLDTTASNTGIHAGVFARLKKDHYERYLQFGDKRVTYMPPFCIGCIDHVCVLATTALLSMVKKINTCKIQYIMKFIRKTAKLAFKK